MRILILSQYFWPESFKINEIAQSLVKEGCEVVVITGQPNYPDGKIFSGYSWWKIEQQLHNGIRIVRVPIFPRKIGTSFYLAINYLSFIFSAFFFGAIMLSRCSIDKVLIFGLSPILQALPGIFIAFLKKAPIILWVQDLWPESLIESRLVKNKCILGVVEKIVRWIYRRCDLILVQSEAFIDLVENLSGDTPVKYHPNPGDAVFNMIGDGLISPFKFQDKFNIVFAGNMGTVQALDTIILCAEILRNDESVHFIMVGKGSRVNYLASEIERLNLRNIDLVGPYDVSLMPLILVNSSALLISLVGGVAMSRTIPSKLQSYLASGRPIIGSIDGEASRIIQDAQAGLVARAEDPHGLANVILEMKSKSKTTLDQMGRNGRVYYEKNFEPRLLTQKLKDFLCETEKIKR